MQDKSTTPQRRVRARVAATKGGPSGRCAACAEDVAHLSLDHIVPFCEGGGHAVSNLQWLCRPCHRKKSTAEWYRWFEAVGKYLPRIYSEDRRKAIGDQSRGRTPSAETLALRRESMTTRWRNTPPERRAEIAAAVSAGHQNGPRHTNRGPRSEETRRKIGEAQKRAWASGKRRTASSKP